jgi:hypothetical protein
VLLPPLLLLLSYNALLLLLTLPEQPLRDQAGMVSQLVCCCRCCWLCRQR